MTKPDSCFFVQNLENVYSIFFNLHSSDLHKNLMVSGIIVVALVGFAFESIFITDSFQLTVGTVTLKIGQNVLLNVEEELR